MTARAKASPRSLYSRPSCPKDVFRRLLLALLPALAAALFAAPAAHAGFLFPESGGSPNADSIKTLYIMVFVLALFIFAGVEGALLYSLFKLPRPQGPARRRRSTATRSSRSAGPSAPP